jgi:hypothetical protein
VTKEAMSTSFVLSDVYSKKTMRRGSRFVALLNGATRQLSACEKDIKRAPKPVRKDGFFYPYNCRNAILGRKFILKLLGDKSMKYGLFESNNDLFSHFHHKSGCFQLLRQYFAFPISTFI